MICRPINFRITTRPLLRQSLPFVTARHGRDSPVGGDVPIGNVLVEDQWLNCSSNTETITLGEKQSSPMEDAIGRREQFVRNHSTKGFVRFSIIRT